MINRLIFFGVIIFSSCVHSYEQSYESCSLTAWEVFGSINDFLLGVPIDKAKESAATPENVVSVYKISKDPRIKYTYISSHVHYKKCSASVKNYGVLSKTEVMYKVCAYKSATRTNILIYIDQGESEQSIKEKLPTQYHDIIGVLYSTAKTESFVKAANESANSLIRCVESVRESENA